MQYVLPLLLAVIAFGQNHRSSSDLEEAPSFFISNCEVIVRPPVPPTNAAFAASETVYLQLTSTSQVEYELQVTQVENGVVVAFTIGGTPYHWNAADEDYQGPSGAPVARYAFEEVSTYFYNYEALNAAGTIIDGGTAEQI